ncbi:NACHT domain-containing protein [Streptomyces sp. NPDC002668]|uniref:NACHT domain-containing protein n=1 Tax=Streptomyces sp. NPDC002668 TaxID=3154422 RepID=UPI003322162A
MTLAAAGWVIVQLARGQDVAGAASLIGLVVSVMGLVVAAAGLRAALAALGQPADAAVQAISAAATLARQVERVEAEQWRLMVGGERQRINLCFTLHPQSIRSAQVPGPQGQLFDQGVSTVPDIAGFYRATTPARLVVTGAPGAGKTVLALELLLALIEHRTETDPVPVRISLAAWNTTTPLQWFLTGHLVQAYDWPWERARQLVEHGLVLPVLDGLDEMDAGLSVPNPRVRPPRPRFREGGYSGPVRSRIAMELLNAYSRGRTAGPLVLTCRTSRYDALADDDLLGDAARISIAPVSAPDAAAYLTDRCGHDQRWQPLLDHLRAEPAGVLSRSLSTPWRLSLAATVYRRTGNPGELLPHPTAQAVEEHLLTQLIPATTTLQPPARGYSPVQVHTWLAVLARHLLHPPTSAGPFAAGPAADIDLHQLWPIAGPGRVRAWGAALTGLAVAATAPLAWITPNPAGAALTIALLALLAAGLGALPDISPPARLNWQALGTSAGRRRLARKVTMALGGGLICGIALGLGAMLVINPRLALLGGLVGGLAVGMVTGLAAGFQEPTDAVLTPGGVLRANALSGLGFTLGGALLLGAAGELVCGHTAGLIFALVGGLAGGSAAGVDASWRYLVFLLCSRRILPFRLNAFLAYSYDVGLLRRSGNAYQFRHRELQQWLADHPTLE